MPSGRAGGCHAILRVGSSLQRVALALPLASFPCCQPTRSASMRQPHSMELRTFAAPLQRDQCKQRRLRACPCRAARAGSARASCRGATCTPRATTRTARTCRAPRCTRWSRPSPSAAQRSASRKVRRVVPRACMGRCSTALCHTCACVCSACAALWGIVPRTRRNLQGTLHARCMLWLSCFTSTRAEGKPSWTARLLSNPELLCKKVRVVMLMCIPYVGLPAPPPPHHHHHTTTTTHRHTQTCSCWRIKPQA